MEHDWPWGPHSIYCPQWMQVSSKQDFQPQKVIGAVQSARREIQVRRGQLVCSELEEWPQVLSYTWAVGRLPRALQCQRGAVRLKQETLHGSGSSNLKESLNKRKAILSKRKGLDIKILTPKFSLHGDLSVNTVGPGNIPTRASHLRQPIVWKLMFHFRLYEAHWKLLCKKQKSVQWSVPWVPCTNSQLSSWSQ